jgi:Bacterial Ig-like domain (group 2)
MKRLSLALLTTLAATAACDSPTGGGPAVERLIVTPSRPSLNVGQTVQLAAEARDDQNLVLADVEITWTALDPAKATVSATGLVTGVAGGEARVVGAADNGVADTATVTVFAVAAACTTDGSAPTLAVGESVQYQGAAAATLCLGGQGAGAEYVVVPFFGTENQAATLALRAVPVGVMDVLGPPNPSLSSFTGTGLPAAAAAGRDGGFHTRLNERARAPLSRLVPAARRAQERRRTGPRFDLQLTTPTVGSLLDLNVGLEFCDQPTYRTGRVVAVSNRAVVVADTGNPANGLSTADYEHVAVTFDTLVYPVNTAAFGAPGDVDQNGRSVIFYTRAVNELTPANANYVVGGFFYGRDLFPRTASDDFDAPCAGSNFAEMFYMLAADPTGVVNGNVRTVEDVTSSTLGTVGHEFQHLISASRRLYEVPGISGTDWSEDTWLNEGLSHIAEELLFYHRAQRSPRTNIGASVLATGQPGREAYIEFQGNNFGRFELYLENPDQDSPYDVAFGEEDDLSTRGAAWAFLRYAADRRGGDENTLWYGLVNSTQVGLANIQAHLGDPIPLFRDFAVSLYTDDSGVPVPAILTQPSWNHRSLYTQVTGAYPLEVTELQSGIQATTTLVAGGAAFLRAAVGSGQRASIELSSAGGTPPATLMVTVVRTR